MYVCDYINFTIVVCFNGCCDLLFSVRVTTYTRQLLTCLADPSCQVYCLCQSISRFLYL